MKDTGAQQEAVCKSVGWTRSRSLAHPIVGTEKDEMRNSCKLYESCHDAAPVFEAKNFLHSAQVRGSKSASF